MTEHSPPRIAIIGAGSRGRAYAHAVSESRGSDAATVSAIVDPIAFKRQELGERYVWGLEGRAARPCEQYDDWRRWAEHEALIRRSVAAGEELGDGESTTDAVIICVLDELHVEVILGLKEAGLFRGPRPLHVLCEKPLATTLGGVLAVYNAMRPQPGAHNDRPTGTADEADAESIFSICHVLRYSAHNMMLRQLLLEEKVVGDILSVEHVEPVGWWHFSHSYVRGNWRNSATSAPSLLTKSCHDVDFLLWMLCSPSTSTPASQPPHLPSYVSSTGSLHHFRSARKPLAAGNATNCLECPIERDCNYSAKKIYVERHLDNGVAAWPVNIVAPEIEDMYTRQGPSAARGLLLDKLAEDYLEASDATRARGWYGRCVWESDNDVCDDQTVTVEWEDDVLHRQGSHTDALQGRGSKTATFHMVAGTEAQCERRGRVYGTHGEVTYDSTTISIHDFATGETRHHHPKQAGGGHGGGDGGLIRQFIRAVDAVKNGQVAAQTAQRLHLGCTLEEVVRSHAVVWAAEEARRDRKVVGWKEWWAQAAGLPQDERK